MRKSLPGVVVIAVGHFDGGSRVGRRPLNSVHGQRLRRRRMLVHGGRGIGGRRRRRRGDFVEGRSLSRRADRPVRRQGRRRVVGVVDIVPEIT